MHRVAKCHRYCRNLRTFLGVNEDFRPCKRIDILQLWGCLLLICSLRIFSCNASLHCDQPMLSISTVDRRVLPAVQDALDILQLGTVSTAPIFRSPTVTQSRVCSASVTISNSDQCCTVLDPAIANHCIV